MDLFSVVKLAKPALVTVGVRPLREGETPILEATAGHTMELAQEEPANASPTIVEATPLRSFPNPLVQSPEGSRTESAESVEIRRADSEPEEVSQGVKRKQSSGGNGAGTSKRRRHVITIDASSEEDGSPSIPAQETAEASSPK